MTWWETIDDESKPIAGTIGSHIEFNLFYLRERTELDIIGIVVHETVHVFQDAQGSPHWWQIEGTADLIRMECTKEIWIENGSPLYGYRHAAMFLKWLEKKYECNIVKPLCVSIRQHTYSDEIFYRKTGLSLEQLIKLYLHPPPLPPPPKPPKKTKNILTILWDLLVKIFTKK